MFKAAWRSLWGRKLRLVMSTFAIVLGVAFVSGTLIFTDTLDKSFTQVFDNTVGDVVVNLAAADDAQQQGQATTLNVPRAVVDTLADLPGAERADGNVVSATLFVINQNNKLVGGNGPPGLGLSDNDAPPANGAEPLQIVEGDHPRNEGEVALYRNTAEDAGYALGDTVRMVNATGKPPLFEAKLVGIADFPDAGSMNGATAAIFDTATAQKLFLQGADAYSDVWVTAKDGVSHEELAAQAKQALGPEYLVKTGEQAAEDSASAFREAIGFLSTFLLVFAGIALFVGIFLILNTFSMLVAQRSKELALLRALGASRGQVIASVMAEALILGVIGSTIGIALGVALAVGIRALFAQFGLDLSGTSLVFTPATIVKSYIAGVPVPLIAAVLPSWRSGRVSPVAVMRDDVATPASRRLALAGGATLIAAGVASGALGLLADVPKPLVWLGVAAVGILVGVAVTSTTLAAPFLIGAQALFRRLFGSVGQLAGSNARRQPGRTAATAAALMIGLTLVTTMAIMGSSAKASVDDAIDKAVVGDLVVANAVNQPFSTQVATSVAKVPGVESVAALRLGVAKRDGKDVYLNGVDPTAVSKALDFGFTSGSLTALDDSSLAISESLAKDEGLGVGDSVTLKFPTGPKKLKVSGVFSAPVGGSWMVTNRLLEQGGFPPADSFVLINLSPGVNAAGVQDQLEKMTSDNPMITVKNQQQFRDEQSAQIDMLVQLIYALLGLALVIAVLGVVNTLGLSVIERTREIGLLRAVGLSRAQLRRMIALESIVIAVLGALLGVLLGIGFGLALVGSLEDEGLGIVQIPWANLITFLVIAVVVGLLAAIFPARRAAKLDILTAISTE